MSRRLVLENEFAHVWFHPEARIVHHQVHKFIWGEAYQQMLNDGLDALVCEGATKWLSENRDDTVHSRADTEWVVRDWIPRARKAGWKYWAVVPPANVIGQMNIERLLGEAQRVGVVGRIFSEIGPAFIWLDGVS